jgi:integrase/recombinase XerD
LVPSAFDEIKEVENKKIQQIREQYQQDMKSMREQMNQQFNQIMSMIQHNPTLANIKPKVLITTKPSKAKEETKSVN